MFLVVAILEKSLGDESSGCAKTIGIDGTGIEAVLELVSSPDFLLCDMMSSKVEASLEP